MMVMCLSAHSWIHSSFVLYEPARFLTQTSLRRGDVGFGLQLQRSSDVIVVSGERDCVYQQKECSVGCVLSPSLCESWSVALVTVNHFFCT